MLTRMLSRLLIVSGLIFILYGCAGIDKTETASGQLVGDTSPVVQPRVAIAESEAPPAPALTDVETDTIPSRTIATEPFHQAKAPELLARIDGPELEPLRLLAQDITVVISGHRARVVFDMVFYNHSTEELSGTLMVQIPNRAGPSFLGMYLGNPLPGTDWADDTSASILLPEKSPGPDEVLAAELRLPGSWQTGEASVDWGEFRPAVVVEPVKGRQVYESVTRKKVDPALGEWTGTGSYAIRIFPIPANGIKRVVFAYDQTLVPDDGKVVLSLPVAPDSVSHRRLTVHDIGISYSKSIVIRGEEIIEQGRSPYGRMWKVNLAKESALAFSFTGTMRNPVFLHLTGADSLISGTLTTLVITPETPARSMVTPTGRALILLDTSYSGKDGMHEVAGKLLRALLESDDSLLEFAIVAFDVRATLLTSGFVPNTEEVRDHYLTEVSRIWLEGATDFESALRYIEDNGSLAQADTMFLLSDGLITWGSDDVPALLREHQELASARWICYSVGSVPQNLELFAALTRSGGQIVPVVLSQDLNRAARAHRFPVSRLDGVFSMLQDEIIVAGNPEFVYPGQVLEVAIRSTRTTQDVRLTVRVNGRDSELKVPIARLPLTDPIAARSWAEIYTADLLSSPDEAAIQAALSLSRHFNLTSDYASFIILETDEEYKQFEIETPPFDFRQIRLTLVGRGLARAETPRVYSGLSVPVLLGSDTESLIKSLSSVRQLRIWEIEEPRSITRSSEVLVEQPLVGRTSDTVTSLYAQGSELLKRMTGGSRSQDDEKEDAARDAAGALRVLSSIAELAPRDAQALRLSGYVLMDWGFHAEASRIFARVRESRPFEPQNLLLESMALAAEGLVADAALRYEVVLGTTFPRFGEFAKPVARFLYADLLRSVLREESDHPFAHLWENRLRSLEGENPEELPAGVLFLYWNLDDTDVDLHVKENIFSRVWYEKPKSRSGGELLWDNTVGLGPEMFTHPKLSRTGFEVAVNYFSSSSVLGAAPAATLICALTRAPEGEIYRAEWHARILVGVQEELVGVMPVWKRAR